MNETIHPTDSQQPVPSSLRSRIWSLMVCSVVGAIVAIAGHAYTPLWQAAHLIEPALADSAEAPPSVVVSYPLQHDEDTRIAFLGQFAAVDRVELRAQVGGILAEIYFQDGQIVHKGDLLFVIDPTPYEITLAQAKAQLASANAKYLLAQQELFRAQSLKQSTFGTVENVDLRTADLSAASAAVQAATATIRDASFDLLHCNIVAPFSGRIGAHQISVGNLIAGSRFASAPTTLLGTLVTMDPIYLNFDMSEADYLTFEKYRSALGTRFDGRVMIRLSDEAHFLHQGVLDFVNNEIDRSSGTIHARATVPNVDLSLTPGEFGRVRLQVSPPKPTLLVPDASVLLDQDQHVVLTVAADGTVVSKLVTIGGLRGGLRIVSSGLTPRDRVIIDGIVRANPGMKVTPQAGSISYGASDDQH